MSRHGSGPVADNGFDPGPALRQGMNETWRIQYSDRNGVWTERTVLVLSLHGDRFPKYLHAYCWLRRDYRHFRVANIDVAVDADGQRVPVGPRLLDWLDQRERDRHVNAAYELSEPVPVVVRNWASGETWDMAVTAVLVRNGRPLVRGPATRRVTPHHPERRGLKTFGHDNDTDICDPDTSETWPDPRTHPDIARQIGEAGRKTR
ncbi:MAG: WYL domain-containing protein [Minwuia sp.]|nr:WYL domain-containing protein [Minwuia sp.]